MSEVFLTIWSEGQATRLPLTANRLTVGRGEQADLCLGDQGLSRVHASINREQQRLWILDEGSTNGTFVNGKSVLAEGTPLRDGDQITLGDTTKIKISFAHAPAAVAPVSPPMTNRPAPPSTIPHLSMLHLFAAGTMVVVILSTAAFGIWKYRATQRVVAVNPTPAPFTPIPTATEQPQPSAQGTAEALPEAKNAATTEDSTVIAANESSAISGINESTLKFSEIRSQRGLASATKSKPYRQMSEAEQIYFIHQKAQEVARKVGNRPADFPDVAITIIKYWLDAYVKRIGNGRTNLWGEDLRFMFDRARRTFTPTIIRAFNANSAPPVVGVYLPVIETEYRNISTNNFAGAAGLFQFLGDTAEGYGVPRGERTNIEKMAPAAARYIKDRLNEFGPDAAGVGLSIAGYNRSADSVRRDLHDVINSDNRDRDFWNLVKNKAKLDHWFQDENINYVPRFFAAAIIGENPWRFGLEMRALSTYTDPITVPPQ